MDTTGEVGTREAVGPHDGSLIDVETYSTLPTKTVNLVILEQFIASVANPSQQRKLGPGKDEYLKNISDEASGVYLL